MAPRFSDDTMKMSLLFVDDSDESSIRNTLLPFSHVSAKSLNTTLQDGSHNTLPTVAQYVLSQYDCIQVRFSEMEYIPWNNSDNIVSEEVESTVLRFKDNLLGFLFLIGGPANVINMAVFYKQGLKDRVNLCLFALSLTDELYLIVLMMLHGEQLHLQFTTKEKYGPMRTFLANINFVGFIGLYVVSPVLSAIIALERCYCVLRPLKIQTLMSTRTMATIIITVYVLVLGLFFIVAFRYHVGCIYDPDSGIVLQTIIAGEFYENHRQFIDFLEGFVFGLGLPGIVMIVVTACTIITIVKLRQIVTWRAETSSTLSPREVALTKMLVGNSILFIACVSPIALIHCVWLFFPEMMLGRRNHNFFLICVWVSEIFSFVNASFNFFVYFAAGSRYRETFWVLFGRKRKPEKK